MLRFAFVLEQTLGHVSHTRNIERALARASDIEPSVIRIDYPPRRRMPLQQLTQNWSLRASWRARAALRERLRAGRIDAVFIHTQVASLLSGSIMRAVPTVVSLDATPVNVDDLGAAYRHSRNPGPMEAVKRAVNRRAFSAARGLVTWSDWAAASLQRHYAVDGTKISVIHPGVDLELFRPGTQRRAGPLARLLFVGGDFARKGGTELLDAVRALDGQVELDIVSPSAPAVEGGGIRIHRNLGPQSPGLVELYRQADVFVLPTLGDCFPQVIAEALASGLPVVATKVGGIPEMVTHGVNGFLVPPGDTRELGAALRRLAGDPAARAGMGAESLARARLDHDAMRNNRRIFDLMAGLAAVPQAATA